MNRRIEADPAPRARARGGPGRTKGIPPQVAPPPDPVPAAPTPKLRRGLAAAHRPKRLKHMEELAQDASGDAPPPTRRVADVGARAAGGGTGQELQTAAPGAEGGALSLLGFVAMAVKDPSIDVAKLQALLDMQRQIVADEAKAQFNAAMARVQPKLPRIKKNGEVRYPINKNEPDGPSRYAFSFARWEDVDAGIRPILIKEGFTLSFNTKPRQGDGGGLIVVGELLHVGGHAKTAEFALPLDTSGGKSNLQGYASSTSFGQRYCAKMLLNIIFESEDDDGVAGGRAYINDEMKQRITTLLRETKADLEAFLRFAHARSVDEIESADYVRVVNMLETKKKRMAGAAAPQPGGGEGAP